MPRWCPLLIDNVPRIKELLQRMGEPKTNEVAQEEQHAQLSSSSYKSLNSATDNVLVINTLRKMGMTKFEEKHQASSLASHPIWRKKFHIGK